MDSKTRTEIAISRIHFPVTSLGPGQRIGLWFQGCSIRCGGCMSRDTWDDRPEQRVEMTELFAFLGGLDRPDVAGITISGGEPFDQAEALYELVVWLRSSFCHGNRDILVYSGYHMAALVRDHARILASVDALISEPFQEFLAPRSSLRWRGSPNQVLTPQSKLGECRYGPEVNAPSKGEIQLQADGNNLWIVGVPKAGDIGRLEQLLYKNGIGLHNASWR